VMLPLEVQAGADPLRVAHALRSRAAPPRRVAQGGCGPRPEGNMRRSSDGCGLSWSRAAYVPHLDHLVPPPSRTSTTSSTCGRSAVAIGRSS